MTPNYTTQHYFLTMKTVLIKMNIAKQFTSSGGMNLVLKMVLDEDFYNRFAH